MQNSTEESTMLQKKTAVKSKNKKKSFQLRGKQIALTYPRCDVPKVQMIDFLKKLFTPVPSVILVAQELHSKETDNGKEHVEVGEQKHPDIDEHLHCYLELSTPCYISNEKFFDYTYHDIDTDKDETFHPNIQIVKNKINWLNYCIKEKNYECEGIDDVEEYLVETKKHKKHPLADLISGKKTIIEIVKQYPQYLTQIPKLQVGINLFKFLDNNYSNGMFWKRQCFWIWGSTGVGKSFSVRVAFPSLYNKQKNSWWEGYNNEKAILIDDLGQDMGEELKIWGDDYLYTSSVKFSSGVFLYRYLIVTSNYSPNYFYPIHDRVPSEKLARNVELLAAIERRFTIIHAYKDETNGHYIFDKNQLLCFDDDEKPIAITENFVPKEYKTYAQVKMETQKYEDLVAAEEYEDKI